MNKRAAILFAASTLLPICATASSDGHDDHYGQVSNHVSAEQRITLTKNTFEQLVCARSESDFLGFR